MREKFEKRDLSRIIDHQELGLIIFALLVLQKELVDIILWIYINFNQIPFTPTVSSFNPATLIRAGRNFIDFFS